MARFIHIDHCLCRFGGHEYDYAVNVLGAAEAAGYEAVLATHRNFRDQALLPPRWAVYPVFPFTTYHKHCFWYGGHEKLPFGLDGESLPDPQQAGDPSSLARVITGGFRRLGELPRRRERRRLVHGFALACGELFQEIRPDEGDHVFFATITEFDILGLARYFKHHPNSRTANWHLQFHFGLYGGCGPDDSARNERRRKVRHQFEVALAHLPDDTIWFYNTTEQLATQYNQLNVGRFHYIPYPVSPTIESGTTARDGPLRVTCAGAARRDKRIRELKGIAGTLRSDRFFDGRLELAAQLPPRKARRLGISPVSARHDPAEIPFLAIPHPLERAAYHELIDRTDIGLFLHDSRRYHAQCSGVLHEMLAAGKPVIVPGGCWLADQIAEPISEHIEGLCAALPTVACITDRDLRWRLPSTKRAAPAGGTLSVGGADTPETQFSRSHPATELVVGFRWKNRAARGTYVRLQLDQFDGAGQAVSRFMAIVGQRRSCERSVAQFRLDPKAVRCSLRLRNAYDYGPVVIGDVALRFLDAGSGRGCPAGQVGLIAATPAQIPALLRDMVEYFPHYRESAAAFSHGWCQTHHPARTMEILTGGDSNGRAAAA